MYRSDDPVRDAEDVATDKRPILGNCEICGCEIHGGDEFYEPDDAYCIDDDYVCFDCLYRYMSRYKIE